MKLTYSLLIAACLAIAVFCVAYPVYVIWPFRHQGVTELAVALDVLRFRTIALAICAAAAVAAMVLHWRAQPRVLPRIFSALGVAAVCGMALLARVNIYEQMFHPLGQPSFQTAQDTKLDGDEKVIAVKVGGVARAYPIRSISYHHIVNDMVGGAPIVATY